MSEKNKNIGAASGNADAESGTEGLNRAEDNAQALRALEAMHERGLIPDEVFEARKKELSE